MSEAKALLLGRYRVLRALARGGMGVVYLARTEGAKGFSRPVVIKRVLPGSSTDSEQMFVREARILSALSHPGIVGVIDFERVDQSYVMVLEYVHGRHLGLWIKCVRQLGQRMHPVVATQIIIKMLDALSHAHTLKRGDGSSLDIVHRDVSPSNILIDTEGHVKLVDFGVARMLGDESSYITKEVAFKGKLSYTAPEIFQEASPSRVTDVYAAAVVLHEMLVGRNELRGEDDAKTLVAVLRHSPTPPSQVRDDVGPDMDRVLFLALAKRPEERYQSASEFAEALRAVRTESESDADKMVAQGVTEIFPEIERIMKVTPLAQLEEAWRRPPADDEPLDPDDSLDDVLAGLDLPAVVPINATLEPQDQVLHSTLPPPPKPSRWPLWLALALATIAAIASGLALYFGASSSTTNTPVIIIESNNRTGEDDADPTEPGDPVGPAAASGESDAAGPLDAGTRRRRVRPPSDRTASPARQIGRRFARRQREIQACFTRQASDVTGAPRIVVVFVVATDGRVQQASLEPGSVTATPLGACLLGIARTTNFGRQPGTVQVRIPITARAR